MREASQQREREHELGMVLNAHAGQLSTPKRPPPGEPNPEPDRPDPPADDDDIPPDDERETEKHKPGRAGAA